MANNLESFCNTSTIHGVSFWTYTQNLISKALWVFIVILGIASASFMIWNNFQTWAANPVVVSVVQVPIEQAPFPSITICPLDTTPLGSIELDLNNLRSEESLPLSSKLLDILKIFAYEMMMTSLTNVSDPCIEAACNRGRLSDDKICQDSNEEFRLLENQSSNEKAAVDRLNGIIDELKESKEPPGSLTTPFNETDAIDTCPKLYKAASFLSRIRQSLRGLDVRPGTLFTWLYAQAGELKASKDDIRKKLLNVLNPKRIPRVSGSRFGTRRDVFIPDMVEALSGNEDKDVTGIEYKESLFQTMKYSSSPAQIRDSNGTMNPNPGMPFCLFANSDEDGMSVSDYPEKFCSSMQPVVNEDGLCYTYNNVDFGFDSWRKNKKDLVKIPGVGHKKGLTLVIDSHHTKLRSKSENEEIKGYKVIVTVPGAIAAKVSFVVEPDFSGEHSFYLHGIHYIIASEDVIEWNKNAKVCYFPFDKNLTFYNYYLQDNCLQECKLKKIVQTCGCSPWFLKRKDPAVCDSKGMKCFKDKVENYRDDLKDRQECDCKNDCEMVHFFYSMRQEAFNKNWFDSESRTGILRNYLIDPNNAFQDPLTRNLTKLLRNYDDARLAQSRLDNDIAVLNFFFDTPIISNFKLEMKVTVFDQISAIGGTLGLFAGISLISMFEIVYWLIKAVFEIAFGTLSGGGKTVTPVQKVDTQNFRRPIFVPSF